MKLSRPNFFQIVLGSLTLAIKERFARQYFNPPVKLGKYTLVKKITKRNRFKNTAVAVYAHQGKKYLVKLWHGRIRDMKYFFLVDEFMSTQTLSRLIAANSSSGFKVPRPIEVLSSKSVFASVYEFIPGHSLKNYPKAYQAKIISEIIHGLTYLSSSLNSKLLSGFPTRRPVLYMLTFPLITLIMLVTSPEEIGIIISSLTLSLLPLTRLFTNHLVLSHRDLTPNNVLIVRDKPLLLDCENLALTVPGYDVSYLGSLPNYSSISKLLHKHFGLKASKPLQTYITLQQSMGTKSHARPYLNYLRQLFK